jgi:hypothetical protein
MGKAAAPPHWRTTALQNYSGRSFLLGFVEFDDQGKPYIRDQITTLFTPIEQEARYQDLSIVIFVHGWKHNDAPTDTNVIAFRLLQQIAEMELQRRRVTGRPARWWASISGGAGSRLMPARSGRI